MPNWENIRKLRDHLKSLRQTKYRKFAMEDYIQFMPGRNDSSVDAVDIAVVRRNGASCGYAACLFGDAIVLLSPPGTKLYVARESVYCNGALRMNSAQAFNMGQSLLGLNSSEADHVSLGLWTDTNRANITKRQALKYLDKVLAERNIMVRI